ncbi:QueT transporter family protein [Atopobium deltae]|uniref:QueT transporter n=1 Tax=Atopobium deltae TaxID=1393034 RepID=A0A133XWG6_9ACTN|nr:QueT transporter family protein [Atopobium deltae]KXB35296.1 hypothetical protein HMPREF3192_00377 [Atopobium deltae]
MSNTKTGLIKELKEQNIARIGVIAAVYAAASIVTLTALSGLAWGPIQFRVSEALCVLALFTPEAIPGLTLGCIIANVYNIIASGSGVLGLLDVIFGSLATLLAAWFTWRLRKNRLCAFSGPVLANAIIVPAYLPIILSGLGFYTIPFTSISLEGSYIFMYLFGFITTGLGEAVVLYVVGLPLAAALARVPFMQKISQEFNASQEFDASQGIAGK